MTDILANILSDAIWVLLGGGLLKLFTLMRSILPARRLWKLQDPGNLVICTANSTTTDTGEYLRPATGIGQVRALAPIITSLNKAYGELDFGGIYFSTDQLGDKLENDLILLGGAKNNEMTQLYLDLLKNVQPAQQEGSTIIWRKKSRNQWMDVEKEEFYGEANQHEIITDYGLIIRARSPFTSRKRSTVLLAGSHTYGTIAAAKYFTENLPGYLLRRAVLN